ncbi:MAG: hypothetical protein KJT03_04655 [Verrucomicrobiae bacterium]|nr:hypothetical protein [Verrucomicrobiae bacterium]
MTTFYLSLPKGTVLFTFCFWVMLFAGLPAQTVYEQLVVRSPLPTPNHINHLEYENGKFLATVDGGGLVLSSDDGISWEVHETGYNGNTADIAYGNGIYMVTSAGSGPAFFSSDLENWTEIGSNLLPGNNDNVYFHNGLFYFGGVQFKNNEGQITRYGIVSTADGINFNNIEIPGEKTVRDIHFASGIYVSVGDGLEVMTSADGASWTLQNVDVGIPEDSLAEGLLDVDYWNSLFVVGGKDMTILTSPDAVTWTKRDFAEDNSWFWASYYEGGTYYFPGRQGKLWSTTDWTTWTAVNIGGNDDVYGIKNAEGLTVTVGRSGEIYSSPDMSVWTSRKEGYSESFAAVAYGAGLFLITDFDGNIIKSTDGITWEPAYTPGIELSMRFLVFEDNKFVAMTTQGEWVLSVDGNLWSLPTDGFEGFPGLNALRYLDDLWWVTGSNGLLRSSTNLTNWNTRDVSTTEFLTDVTLGDGVYVAVGSGGVVFSSPDGVTWNERTSGTSNRLSGVAYGNGKFVAIGTSRTLLTSADGTTWIPDDQVNDNPFSPQSISFKDGQFVVLEVSGRVYLSSDGLNWTQVSASVSATIRDTAVSDTTMVAVGNDGLILTGDLPPPKTLTVNIVGEGTVDVSPDQEDYPHLSMVTLTANDSADFAFSHWSGDASGNANPLVVTMNADKTITANFVLALTGYELWRYINFTTEQRADDELSGPEADFDEDGLTNFQEYELQTNPKEKDGPHTLTVNISGEGSVELSPADGPYIYASEVSVTATGTPEFAFTGWTGDVSSDDNPLVLTMDEDKTITANFSLDLDGFALFRYSEFSPEERVDDALAGPQADYDKDGLTNLEEYLLGTDPQVPNFGKGVQMGTVEIGGKLYLTITYNLSKDISGVTQTVEVGEDLLTWLSGPTYTEEYDRVDNGDGTETVTVRVLDPVDSLTRWFVRLLLEES